MGVRPGRQAPPCGSADRRTARPSITVRVVVTPEAEEHIRAIDTWWRGERPAAPGLFAEELAAALAILVNPPLAGRRYRHATVAEVRRLLLRSTRYHIYYRPYESDVVVLAV